jgi:hypothetical protein
MPVGVVVAGCAEHFFLGCSDNAVGRRSLLINQVDLAKLWHRPGVENGGELQVGSEWKHCSEFHMLFHHMMQYSLELRHALQQATRAPNAFSFAVVNQRLHFLSPSNTCTLCLVIRFIAAVALPHRKTTNQAAE